MLMVMGVFFVFLISHITFIFSKNIPTVLRRSKQRIWKSEYTRRKNVKFIGGKRIT